MCPRPRPSPVRRRRKFPTWPARLRKTHDIRAVAASHIVSSSPYETQYYCAAFLDAGQCKCFNFLFAFCFNPKGVHYYGAALQDAGECKCLIFLSAFGFHFSLPSAALVFLTAILAVYPCPICLSCLHPLRFCLSHLSRSACPPVSISHRLAMSSSSAWDRPPPPVDS